MMQGGDHVMHACVSNIHALTLTQEAIMATLEGRDSLLILPTGAYGAVAAAAFVCLVMLFTIGRVTAMDVTVCLSHVSSSPRCRWW
jgi:hypothetical protein